MYIPAHFAVAGAAVHELLANVGAADLITATPDGLVATMLPLVYDPTVGEKGALQGHVARTNDQWRLPVHGHAMVIVRGPDAYISPTWYASKVEHGRVVPTWNYVTAHVYGRLVVHEDSEWLATNVRRLTERHEQASAIPWSVDDPPPGYVAGQLRAIVGVEVVIERVEAKAKLSQNRPEADVAGVVAGLVGRGETASAAAVRQAAASGAKLGGQGSGSSRGPAPSRSSRSAHS